ncbi:hypothetical protein B0H17DRAFT_1030803 [Mycena rosella]|uniref:Uncharacterized protein n=1 Tax=Mycena rosella TaxID=1033263 RepID=A0AAD7GZQ3_MYCRO|nr:hypothetical protein B0H17DRAFT_1030803 [Mycena rosella]
MFPRSAFYVSRPPTYKNSCLVPSFGLPFIRPSTYAVPVPACSRLFIPLLHAPPTPLLSPVHYRPASSIHTSRLPSHPTPSHIVPSVYISSHPTHLPISHPIYGALDRTTRLAHLSPCLSVVFLGSRPADGGVIALALDICVLPTEITKSNRSNVLD